MAGYAIEENEPKLVLSLAEFLENFPSPNVGRIVSCSSQDLDYSEDINIRPGSVLQFHRKLNPNVLVRFCDPFSGPDSDHWIKVSVPIDNTGKFNLLPYDPYNKVSSLGHIFPKVEDLVVAFPVFAQIGKCIRNSDIHDYDSDSESIIFNQGDKIKLLRLVYKGTQKFLECRNVLDVRLVLLPMGCNGNFSFVHDHNEYTLPDIVSMAPRERRVKLSESSINDQNRIPGLPSNFTGDLFIDEPDYYIEASPGDNPSLVVGLPDSLDIHISPEEIVLDRGQLLNTFATNNRNLFPVVARVTDWDEETTILENHFIKPGVELVIHGWTRQSKVLARAGSKLYAIPLTYQGKFNIKSQQFIGVSALEKVHPGYKVRVTHVDPEEKNCPLRVGDLIRIKREDSLKRGYRDEDTKFLKCEKFDRDGKAKIKDVKLSVDANIEFEEVLEEIKTSSGGYHIRELISFVTDQELKVELSMQSLDQKVEAHDLPHDGPITLCDFVVESAVYVSVELPDAPAFHIPLRSLVYVVFVEQLEKSSSPLLTKQNPKLSTLDRCVEILPGEVFHQLSLSKASQPTTSLSPTNGFNGVTQNTSQQSSWTSRPLSFKEVNHSTNNTEIISNGVDGVRRTKSVAHERKHRSTENLLTVESSVSHSQTNSLPRPQNRNEYTLPRESTTSESNDMGVARVQVNHIYNNSNGGMVGASPVRQIPTRSIEDLTSVSTHGELSRTASRDSLNTSHSSHITQITSPGPQVFYKVPTKSGQVLQQQVVVDNKVYQPPPGYVLMPANAVPPGYALVPLRQQVQQTATLVRPVKLSTRALSTPSVMTNGSDYDDTMSDISRFTFSRTHNAKMTIPADGNVYHFSSKKMAELLKQFNIEDSIIRHCLKDKIDGKKFSKFTEADMQKYGLMQPVIVHFRNSTYKKKANFML